MAEKAEEVEEEEENDKGCGVSSDEPHPRQDLDILQAGGTGAYSVEPSRSDIEFRPPM